MRKARRKDIVAKYTSANAHMLSDRRERIALVAVLAAGLMLRLAHIHELSGDVLFQHPSLDEERYVNEARRLASGGIFEPRPFWQPPGVMYALALIFRVFGDGLYAPRVIAAVVSTATCALAFAVGKRLMGATIGLATAAVVAFHGVLVFSSAELLPATWAGMFDMLAIYLLLDAPKSRVRAAGAGLALGISVVFAPIVLPFALVAAGYLYRASEDRRAVTWFALSLALPILPVALRNFDQSGHLVLVSTNDGLNLYIGNNERYFETVATRPGFAWDELAGRPQRLGFRDPVEQSAWFRRQAFQFVRAHPLDALALYLRKVWLYFHAAEIPRDADLYAVRDESRVLRALVGPRPLWFPDGLVMPLALIGIGTQLRERARLLLPLSFVGVQALAVALFFVSARYRVPALPVFALFAVLGFVSIVKSVAARRARLISATLALAAVCSLPAREVVTTYTAERDLFRGLAHRKLRDPIRATESFQRATARDPNDFRAWFELGASLDALGRASEAADAWERAGAIDPANPRPRRMAAQARLRTGDRAGAIRVLTSIVATGTATRALDHMELASVHAVAGETAAALGHLRAAREVDPAFFHAAAATFAARHRESVGDASFWAALDELRK